MADGGKSKGGPNAVLIVAAIIAVFIGIGMLSVESDWYESNATNRAHNYARDAEHQIADHCPAATSPNRGECVDKAVNTARDQQREEQDLAAQRVTAWWTRIMGAAAVFGMALSAIGVFLVYTTFQETREANAIAVRDQRAWIRLGVQPKLVRHLGDGRLHFRISFTAENTGKTPATHFAFVHRIFFWKKDEASVKAEIRELISEWKAEYNFAAELNLLPNDVEVSPVWQTFGEKEWNTNAFIGRASVPMMISAVFYRTVSDPKTVQLSWRSWYLQSVDENGHILNRIPLRDDDFGPDELCADSFYRSLVHEEFVFSGDEKEALGPERN